MEMTAGRWAYTAGYLSGVFGREDAGFARIRQRAKEAGLPEISVSADVGRILKLFASMAPTDRALEVGTLGGYSAAWMASGLPNGRVVSIELDSKHAAVARSSLEEVGIRNVEIREGPAAEVIATLGIAPRSLGLVFIDADKEGYPKYFELVRDLIAPRGLLIADNVLGARVWWIDSEGHSTREVVDAFNRQVCADEGFEVVGLANREGLLVARRKG